MTSTIIQMPLLKPLSYFCTDENLAQGEVLDANLRALSQCRGPDSSVEVTMSQWLVNNGVQTEPYCWSVLANMSRSKPRNMMTILMRSNSFKMTEKAMPEISNRVFNHAELMQLTKLASNGSGKFRKSEAFTQPDRDGTRTRFIRSQMVLRRIDEILEAINEAGNRQHTSLKAIWVMLAFLNCHPYADGNGRTSKFLFNLILAKSDISNEYLLPLSAITLGSQGFFEICARRAQLQDSFDMMLKFLETAIALTKMCFEDRPYVFQTSKP
jgi:fido (protein-threonine AMPylation protein)